MSFLKALRRLCFPSARDFAEREKRTEKYRAKLDYLERQLDKEAQQGIGRHFESAGIKIRRASRRALNNAI